MILISGKLWGSLGLLVYKEKTGKEERISGKDKIDTPGCE